MKKRKVNRGPLKAVTGEAPGGLQKLSCGHTLSILTEAERARKKRRCVFCPPTLEETND